MTELFRIPLSARVSQRQSTSDKDALATNVFYDQGKNGTIYANKRPGISTFISGLGQAFGIYSYNGSLFSWSGGTPITSFLWRDAVWNGSNLCVISAVDNQVYSGQVATSIVSSDGLTWDYGFLPDNGNNHQNWTGITWSGTKYHACSYSGTSAYSTDGITWTLGTLANHNWQDITYGNSRLVALAVNTANNISYSTDDGLTWTEVNLNIPAVSSIAYSSTPNKFCFVNSNGSIIGRRIYYSEDAITWNNTSVGATNIIRLCICASSTTFLAPRYFENVADVSTDGITWSQVTLPNAYGWSRCFFNGSYFMVMDDSGHLIVSTDTVNWTSYTLPVISNCTYVFPCGTPSTFLGFGEGDGASFYAYSPQTSVSFSTEELAIFETSYIPVIT